MIGSAHFVFEDEGCQIPNGKETIFQELPEAYSHSYLAVERTLAAAISIEDPIREEVPSAIAGLRENGFSNIIMLTGDSERTACSVARKIGVDTYQAEVLPEEKARYVEQEKAAGHIVLMVGDGINDSPALSAADVGIAINDGAQIAREIADITIDAGSLHELIILKKISNELQRRVKRNYRRIVGINFGLIILGVCGVIQPTTSALIHNASTLMVSVGSMKDLLK